MSIGCEVRDSSDLTHMVIGTETRLCWEHVHAAIAWEESRGLNCKEVQATHQAAISN